MEGGMRVYNLKEVTVTAKRERPSSTSIYTGGINTYTVEEDRLQGYGQTAFDAASRLPSVTITNGSEIHIRNNSEPAIIVIDDIVYEDASDILKDIQVSDMSMYQSASKEQMPSYWVPVLPEVPLSSL